MTLPNDWVRLDDDFVLSPQGEVLFVPPVGSVWMWTLNKTEFTVTDWFLDEIIFPDYRVKLAHFGHPDFFTRLK